MDILVIIFLSIAVLSHLMRLLYLFFKFKFLERLKFVTEQPSKLQMFLYYILTIGVGIYVIFVKIKLMQ